VRRAGSVHGAAHGAGRRVDRALSSRGDDVHRHGAKRSGTGRFRLGAVTVVVPGQCTEELVGVVTTRSTTAVGSARSMSSK
jgi:hypothetical protein